MCITKYKKWQNIHVKLAALQTEQVPKTDKLEKYNMDAMKSFICDIAHEMPSIFKKSWSESIPYYVFLQMQIQLFKIFRGNNSTQQIDLCSNCYETI